jgi:hypothetical protein
MRDVTTFLLGIIAAGAAAVAGLAVIVLLTSAVVHLVRAVRGGVRADAVVVAQTTDGPVVAFVAEDGREQRAVVDGPSRLKPGQLVQVRYRPEAPHEARLAEAA